MVHLDHVMSMVNPSIWKYVGLQRTLARLEGDNIVALLPRDK
jgi:hypothetical protein